MKLPDIWTGLASIVLGIFVVLKSQDFPDVAGGASPRLFPQIIGSLLALLGGAITVRTLIRDGFNSGWESPWWFSDMRKVMRVFYIPMAIVVFALASPIVGTIIVSALLLIGFSLLWQTRPMAASLFGVVFSVALYLFFTEVMRVPLPVGRLLSIF